MTSSELVPTESLAPAYQNLVAAAAEARERAYCPYSGFHVGAALLVDELDPADSPRIITGANVENAAYGSTICAERAALVRANALGFRRFRAVAIIARASGRGPDGRPIPAQVVLPEGITGPCGACRQMLWEAAQLGAGDMDVLLADARGKQVMVTLMSALLPLAFGPRDLGVEGWA